MRKNYFIIFTLLTVLLLGTTAVLASPVVIKLAHEEPANAETSSIHAAALIFKDIIENQSNGTMKVTIYSASSMGDQRERMELTKANILQVNIASIGGISQFYPQISAVDLPFAISDLTTAYKVFDGEFGDILKERILAKTGLRFLTTSGGSFYVLTNSVRPIHTPEDMKGISFRTMSVPTHIAMMESLGASATPIAWSELYTSLQTGVVKGQHNPIAIMAIGGLQEVQDYATLTNHFYGADWWLASDTFYNSLTDEQRRIFTNAYNVAALAGRGKKVLLETNEYGVKFLEENGAEVYSPTTEELGKFRDIVIPAVMEEIENELGSEGVELAEKLLEAVEKADQEIY